MHPVLKRNLFLVKEHIGLFKSANNFDVFDPRTAAEILHCREDRLGLVPRLLRFTDVKRWTPFHIEIRTPSGEPVVHVRRGFSLFLSKVDVLNEREQRTGSFQQHFVSIGGAFSVLDANDRPLCQL